MYEVKFVFGCISCFCQVEYYELHASSFLGWHESDRGKEGPTKSLGYANEEKHAVYAGHCRKGTKIFPTFSSIHVIHISDDSCNE